MILHPGILALLAGSGIVLALMAYGGALGIRIMARWDRRSSSEGQLLLERKTYLVSSLLSYAFGFELMSVFLYIYTVDDIHALFIGAMCATGSLNANPVGWPALGLKIALFFVCAAWLALNSLDQRAEDTPLVRLKYPALLAILPLAALDFYLQLRYFLGLQPEIITSCCGSLFSEGEGGVAAELAGLPARPMMWAFYLAAAAVVATSALCLASRRGFLRYLHAAVVASFFGVAIASIISFISLYIYEMPTHHCPFDILQGQFHFIGYPMFVTLFAGTLFGALPGIFQPLKRVPSLGEEIARRERTWLVIGLVLVLAFIGLSTWPVVFGPFILFG
jgi:hypothetical protein